MSNWITKKATQIDFRTTIKFEDIKNESFVFELVGFDEKLTETHIISFNFDEKEVFIDIIN